MYNPRSTYRIQFHKEFTFEDFEKVLPYLRELGVSTVYASPVFTAMPGSTHGYDVLDPNTINAEIGTEEKLQEISHLLQEANMGWLQDIVPNHMAYDTHNPWVFDILEKGRSSIYANFFDVAWTSTLFHGRLMVPFLGHPLEEVIQNNELKLEYKNNRFVLSYHDASFPLHPRSYGTLFKAAGGAQAFLILANEIENLHKTEDAGMYRQQWHELLIQVDGIMRNKVLKAPVEKLLAAYNNDPSMLRALTEEQVYRLCHWQETDGHINYRRFFTVNGLICLDIQHTEVFREHHQLVTQLVKEGIFQGLRIDHVDGLYNPPGYLDQLRQAVGHNTYIVVEKILEPGESLPAGWPVQGTTGYDFLSMVNNLLTDGSNKQAFLGFYEELAGHQQDLQQQLWEKKRQILHTHMSGELENLFQLLMNSNLVSEPDYAQMRTEDIKTAMAEFLVLVPVYRLYGNHMPFEAEEAKGIETVLQQLRELRADLTAAINLLKEVLLIRPANSKEYAGNALHFYQRCMQFTGPLMAKGVEDTLMYTYNSFIGHNEVGDAPGAFGISPQHFHAAMMERQQHWPYAQNATATHDTKRGEDARARLNVLTELKGLWFQKVREWKDLNKALTINGIPDANIEYLIYQVLVSAYPMNGEDLEGYGHRLQAYIEKALREGKTHSNWASPVEAYESHAKQFVVSLLDTKTAFHKSLRSLLDIVIDFGIVNSLTQLVLKFTCPGVPDVYQGCEAWDLSLVDPDNRRPVDYKRNKEILSSTREKEERKDFHSNLWKNRQHPQLKIWMTHKLFELRKAHPVLFSEGEYQPLGVEGKYAQHVLAFARSYKKQFFIVVVPLHLAKLAAQQNTSLDNLKWEDTRIMLPPNADAEWEHVLLARKDKHEKAILITHLFDVLPFAILKGNIPSNPRGSGILLHVTSLPSSYGIGDMGPDAYAFADLLSRANQRYWQVLPLTPTEEGQGNSPYSSVSSSAGNILLVSPDLLVQEELLNEEEAAAGQLPAESAVDFSRVSQVKQQLFQKAFDRFKQGRFAGLDQSFRQFVNREKEWLDDFAMYILIKEMNGGKPWYEWPEDLKLRDAKTLKHLEAENKTALEKIHWLQFLFDRQWKELKRYCNKLDIQLIGDLPIYISYDSVDVWAHKEIFNLDKEGNRISMAGVPPDAFSEDGQLWGMPVYRWDVLKKKNYHWWIARLRKNMQLFDLLRLDHFRGFIDYWEVPAGSQTARNGQWVKGPGADLFNVIKKAFGDLPFLAEDLGEVDETVFALRDQFGLPGMKVLQFAFGGNMPHSLHIPHQYSPHFLAYTGTHDNNTVTGWWMDEANEANRKALEEYTGIKHTSENVAENLCRMAAASVANTVIFPLQDVMGLGTEARMNKPATSSGNWSWRLLPGQPGINEEEKLKHWTWLYNRE
jgi:malto-oligosyltrehalose synthase/4-alpha-glucanotransferase